MECVALLWPPSSSSCSCSTDGVFFYLLAKRESEKELGVEVEGEIHRQFIEGDLPISECPLALGYRLLTLFLFSILPDGVICGAPEEGKTD